MGVDGEYDSPIPFVGYLRAIWGFLGRYFAFRLVCTGPDYDRTFERMWHLALCASQGNPRAPGGRQWDM